MELFDPQGRRLYLTAEERKAFIEAANNAEREVRTFCLVLAYTGCRISEALATHPQKLRLAREVQEKVAETFSVWLEPAIL